MISGEEAGTQILRLRHRQTQTDTGQNTYRQTQSKNIQTHTQTEVKANTEVKKWVNSATIQVVREPVIYVLADFVR